MAHIGMTEHGLVEVADGHIVILMTQREARVLFKELERMIKWLDKQLPKKERRVL
jgi:hypothetical protein